MATTKTAFINEVKLAYEEQTGDVLELTDEIKARLNMIFHKGDTVQYAVDEIDWLLND